MLSQTHLEKNKLISTKTAAVYDPDFTKALAALPWAEWMRHSPPFDCRKEYLITIDRWIHSSQLNSMTGLQRLSERDLINGTTQAFDEFYFKYPTRRLRFFRGEYAYHRRIARSWAFLEDQPLRANDFVIVSWPFCSTGAKHPGLSALLDEALTQKTPVMIDAAYFGTCRGLEFDFSHPAIEAVCFSLTKGLGLGDLRSGIRYSNYQDQDPVRQQNLYNHTVLGAARIGLHMMERFSPDHIPEKYRNWQKDVCHEAGLTPTPCMHLALGKDPEWNQYRVDEMYNRVGIRELLKARRRGEI
jgi:hypothetical protein